MRFQCRDGLAWVRGRCTRCSSPYGTYGVSCLRCLCALSSAIWPLSWLPFRLVLEAWFAWVEIEREVVASEMWVNTDVGQPNAFPFIKANGLTTPTPLAERWLVEARTAQGEFLFIARKKKRVAKSTLSLTVNALFSEERNETMLAPNLKYIFNLIEMQINSESVLFYAVFK